MKSHRVGYGLFWGELGDKKPRKCNICNTKMNREDYNGPTSWAGAMAKSNRECYRFICPDIDTDWHEQAVNLVMESEKTSSPTLRKILKKDLEDIIMLKTTWE